MDVVDIPLLQIQDVRLRFGGVQALQGFSLSVRPGELLGIIGPNGAGKSTLFNLITGFVRPDEGRVLFAGSDLTHLSPHQISRIGIGRKFQVSNIFEELTVDQNLVAASRGSLGVHALLRPRRAGLSNVDDVAQRVELVGRLDVRAAELSHGEKQWLEIGMVLASRARLLLLDEPTAGMTLGETKKTESMLRAMAGEHTIVVIEHDIRFIREVAERVVVLHHGSVLASGTVAEIEGDDRVREVYLGREA
ncbi:MAG: ATP-binding cassette domain-containing protein [Nitrososphaerales archaeon]